jgi:hypothetical protein
MHDVVHFVFRLEIDIGSAEILQDGAAQRGGGIGRNQEGFVRNLPRRDGLMRSEAMVARKDENQWSVRTRKQAKSPMSSSARMKAASILPLINAFASAGE